MERELAWNKYKNKHLKEMETLCKGYKEFLDNGKTEREDSFQLGKKIEPTSNIFWQKKAWFGRLLQ